MKNSDFIGVPRGVEFRQLDSEDTMLKLEQAMRLHNGEWVNAVKMNGGKVAFVKLTAPCEFNDVSQ